MAVGSPGDWMVFLVFHLVGFGFFWFFIVRPIANLTKWEPPPYQYEWQKSSEYDHWDGEDIDYDTGEIDTDSGPTIRHPKNRDRAYSGSAERFDDGGW
jgi:hypothetical protein